MALRWAVGAVFLVAAYVGTAWYAGRELPAHAAAGGIQVGGLPVEEARARITARAGDVENRPVTIKLGDDNGQIVPGKAGLRIDAGATVSDMVGISLNPVDIWHRLRGSVDVPLRARADRGELTAGLREVVTPTEREVRQGSISFSAAQVSAQRPAAGRRVDLDATADAVVRGWPKSAEIRGVVKDEEPQVSPAAFETALKDVAERAVSKPLTVTSQGRSAQLAPETYSAALSMVPDGDTLTLQVAEKEMLTAVRAAAPGWETPAVNATMRIESGRPVSVPERAGRAYDGVAAVQSITKALTVEARTAELKMLETKAEITRTQVDGYGVVAELGRSTVQLSDAAEAAKLANISTAARALDGRLLPPGGSFSFNEAVGPRTAARGYLATTTAIPGAAGEDDGGVALVSSAVFEAAFRSGLVVGPRTPFSSYVPGLAAGLDARASVGGPDVSFTATPTAGVLMTVKVSGGAVEVGLWGRGGMSTAVTAGTPTEVQRPEATVGTGTACRARALVPGFGIAVQRAVTVDGAERLRDSVTAKYAAVPAVTCR